MDTLTYTVIKTEGQYNQYCIQLEELINLTDKSTQQQDAIDLLTLLIEKWDADHNTFEDADPVELLRYLMNENKLKAVDLAKLLHVSTSLVSDILHYRRGLSKGIIRKLAERFNVSQATFNRPYKLVTAFNAPVKDAGIMNTEKVLEEQG